MEWRFLADVTVVAHLAFIAFVVFGGLFVLRQPRWAWLHLPAVLWVVWLEFTGAACPLTPLENSLRTRAGDAGYAGGFIDHYLIPLIYPAGLTPALQAWLGTGVLAIAVVTYGIAWQRLRAHWRLARRAPKPGRTLRAEEWR